MRGGPWAPPPRFVHSQSCAALVRILTQHQELNLEDVKDVALGIFVSGLLALQAFSPCLFGVWFLFRGPLGGRGASSQRLCFDDMSRRTG